MADRFNVVAVRIEDEGSIVARMILGAKPRTAVFAPTRRHGRLMEGINCSTVIGSKCDKQGLPWLIQKSGLPHRPNPAAEALGSMISS